MLYMQITERIFKLLADKQKDQKDLADYVKASQKTVSAWKTRNSDIPSSYISAIAEFLKVTPEYLLSGSETEKSPSSELTEDEAKALNYYKRLNNEDKDLIKGEMVRLYKDETDSKKDSEFAKKLGIS
jgi:transcriptional regulator with XRE-family HTH domain